MEHIWGFAQSYWMPPLVKCLSRIELAVAMVIDFEWNIQTTNKTQLLSSNYDTFWSLIIRDNFVPQKEPSTQHVRWHKWCWRLKSLRMVEANVGQKLLKRNILRVFTMSLFYYLRRLLLKTRNSKRVFKTKHASIATPTKYSLKLVKCFSSVWYVTPIMLLGVNMSTGALFHDEIAEATGIGVSLL